jgi:hypothetical protein
MMDKKNKIYQTHKKIKEAISARKKIILWEVAGKPIPPPHIVKQKSLIEYAAKFKVQTLVETGTFMGEMIDAVLNIFPKIISIEVDPALAGRAKEKFSSHPHVKIIHGDSGEVLPSLTNQIKEPCLFWLDAHYSGGVTGMSDMETPIVRELSVLLEHGQPDHVILIDDAREFTGKNNYPALEEVSKLVKSRRPDWIMQVKDDVIRIHQAAF